MTLSAVRMGCRTSLEVEAATGIWREAASICLHILANSEEIRCVGETYCFRRRPNRFGERVFCGPKIKIYEPNDERD